MPTHACPQCGKSRPEGAPGLCPNCLLHLGFGDTGDTTPVLGAPTPGADVTPAAGDTPSAESPSQRVGRFKLLEVIGEGGFGTVWMAEQEEPVRRRVALKIIKLGMDTREVVARFEAERQALAMMDHPNIARVFDGGATESGRPYFVMELVKGVRITDYCDANRLNTAERLKLFIEVCQAVQHAHQKGIIHRDLKPSNVLVTVRDDKPVTKVIDFGIAKATEQKLTDKTLFTRFNQVIGTPAYMSPEQAGWGSVDIDTRSDIYSLGVLLYELLTGKPPFDPEELVVSGLEEMLRILREVEPPRPSTRLTSLAINDAIAVSKSRGLSIPSLASLVRGELDWIVMKALEKDRARRYETANGLAMDLQRYLNNEPVAARAPSNLYRFRKMVCRNKGAFAAAAGVLATLTIGLVVLTYLFLRESESRRRAVAAERRQVSLLEQTEAARAAEAAEKQNAREAGLRAERRAKEAELKALEATVVAVDSSLRVGDALSARRRLDAVRPGDRHWEWFWLDGRADSSLVTHSHHGNAGLHYNVERQRLIAFDRYEVREYDPATWKLSGTNRPSSEASPRTNRPGSRDGSRFRREPEIIGLDATGRRILLRSWEQPLALLDRHPKPRWVELEIPAEWRAQKANAATFNSDGTLLTVAYPEGGVDHGFPAERVAHVWDTATGKIMHSLPTRAAKVMVAVFSPDGSMVATGSVEKRASIGEPYTDTLCFWDTKTGALLYSCLDDGKLVRDLAFSPDGKTVYAGHSFGVAIIDVPGSGAHRGKRAEVPLAGERLECLALSSKGDVLAVGCDNGHILLFDAASGARKEVLFGHQTGVSKVMFVRQDTALAALTHDQLKVWDIAHDPRRYALRSGGAPKFAAWSVGETPVLYAYNPNYNAVGGKVGVPGGWGVAEVWDLESRKVRRLPPAASDMTALAFSAKRNVLAFGRRDGVVELRLAPEGALSTQFKAHDGEISALQFSPDGGTLAVGCRDGNASVWDVDGGSMITRLPGDGVEVGFLTFGDGGQVLIAATSGNRREGNTIHQAAVTVSATRVTTRDTLWQWRSERPYTGPKIGLPAFERPSPVTLVGLVGDSQRAIVQTSGGGLIVLDLSTGTAREVVADRSLGHSGDPSQLLSLSPDGARLASIDESTRLVKIFRTEDFAEMLAVAPTAGRARGVSWSPDGTKIAVIGVGEKGGDIEILDVLPSQLRAQSVGRTAPR